MNFFRRQAHHRRYRGDVRAMLKRSPDATGNIKITFALPDAGQSVSVVGDFNGWDPRATPLRKRSNGMRSATVVLRPGQPYSFRYLCDGRFFDEGDADDLHPNGFGDTHSVIRL
jgi:1,4-alpha-glucan branching enzyme